MNGAADMEESSSVGEARWIRPAATVLLLEALGIAYLFSGLSVER